MCFDVIRRARKLLLPAVPALLLPALLLPLAGCGKKGDPLPPLRDVPLPNKDLTVLQQGRLLVLQMTYPSTTVSGMPLGGIDAVELYQMVKPATGSEVILPPTAEFEAGATLLLTLRGAELTATLTGDRIQIRVPLADNLPQKPPAAVEETSAASPAEAEETEEASEAPPAPPAEPEEGAALVHYFGIRTIKGDETSGFSNLVGLIPLEPPAAPENLQATARPQSIELTWESAGELEGFDVYRREASERGYGKPLTRLGADARTFLDRRVEYGKRYIYTVRAIASLDPLMLSAEAGEREIDYEDRFAPPLPASFVALGERSRVRLRWEASEAADVAGYAIWRREPRRQDFHRLGDELVTGVEYLDRGLVSSFAYEYRIQAVDREGNESELSEPVSATVR